MMKKISTRMLVCILTVAVLCSILAVSAFAYSANFTLGPKGAGVSDYKTITSLTRTAIFSKATVKIGAASCGWGKLLLVNDQKIPVTLYSEFTDAQAAATCTKRPVYLFSYKSQTVRFALAVINGDKWGTLQLTTNWEP